MKRHHFLLKEDTSFDAAAGIEKRCFSDTLIDDTSVKAVSVFGSTRDSQREINLDNIAERRVSKLLWDLFAPR